MEGIIATNSRLLRRRAFLKLAGIAASGSALPRKMEAKQIKPAVAAPASTSRARNVYLNQAGYLPDQPKLATVILVSDLPPVSDVPTPDVPGLSSSVLKHPADKSGFEVFSVETGKQVLAGALSAPVFDPLAGDTVCFADLSAVRAPGRYRVTALGHTGDELRVGENAYAEPLYLAMRSYYGQRCGCKVDLGGGYKHGKCHVKGAYGASSGRSGELPNSGGWHDAGDYGRYVVNSGITCGTLLWAWELFPNALRTLKLNLPESGGGLPDFLAEVKWNLVWMLTLQDAADGGVWHKQTSDHFCAFIMPEEDHLVSEVIGTGAEPFKSTCASADFAAVLATAARCYRPFDATFADRCLAAARRAFAWSQAHPAVAFENPPGVTTGGYGDPRCADELLWAAAELFRTTREASFEESLLGGLAASLAQLNVQPPSWGDVRSMAMWTYVFAKGPGAMSDAACMAIQQATQASAAKLVERSKRSAYGTTLGERDFHWGSNSNAANQSLLLLIADRFQPGTDAFATALGNLHYLLGRNCFGVSWVTQVGVRPFLHPHHRPSAADRITAPWPGLLSGGPNAGGGDPVADHLPLSAPMRMWVDDERAYSLNEIAINWNAPLVFLLAAAVEGRGRER